MKLTREEFRNSVFDRDGHKCVICKKDAKDAHHIIERRLFSDGGYYLDNGASLCEDCHIDAEKTLYSCDFIREKVNITKIILPEHFYSDINYDKWGNIILNDNTRLKGELFYDESVQKILKSANILDKFSKYIKYPRTYHLPWSNLLKDDRMLRNDDCFVDRNVVVTLKMDGENTTMYNDYIHARSLDSSPHESRNWIKTFWSKMSYMIDDNMRLCGENLYAKHSIHYADLKSYFMLFSIWIDDKCLSWQDTVEFAKILDLETVPVIYEGIYNKEKIQNIYKKYEDIHEGYVIRYSDEFKYSNFKNSVAKFVNDKFRNLINESHGHWISKKVEKNLLK